MNTRKTLHVGMMATVAAVAILAGCERREPDTTSSTIVTPPASAPSPAPSPGTPGYVGPSEGSSQMQSAPGTTGSAESPPGVEMKKEEEQQPSSGAGSQQSPSPSGPTSSLEQADRPFRDVAVAARDGRPSPAAWRELLGVQVVRVADKEMKSGEKTSEMGGAATLSKKDRKFIDKAAAGGMFEVEAATLAAEKATDPAIKSFAAKLKDQHQQANDELKQIASNKGVTLPTQLPSKEKAMIERLNKASGEKFDDEFIKVVGLRDHKEDIRAFENASKETTDPELKAWIEKTLPTLRTHLAEAQSMSGHEGMKMKGYTGEAEESAKPAKPGAAGTGTPQGSSGIGGTGVGGSQGGN